MSGAKAGRVRPWLDALIGLVLFGAPVAAAAQTPVATLPAGVRLTGRFTAWGELYGRDGQGAATRPGRTGRVLANLSVDVNGLFTLPFSAVLSSEQVSFRQEITQVGLSPRWRWAQLHAGWFTPRYSRYTLADNTVRGGGFDLNPGLLRLGVAAGRTRRAVFGPPGGFSGAALERNLLAGRVGVGREGDAWAELSVMQSEDDGTSLGTATDSLALLPARNRVAGLVGELPLLEHRLVLHAEGAASRHLRDLRTPDQETPGQALSGSAIWTEPRWSLGVTGEWLDRGFTTHGNEQLSSDRRDLGLTGRVALAQGRATLNGTAGWRQENRAARVDGAPETTRAVYNLTADLQPLPQFGVNLTFSNNANDTRQASLLEPDTALIRYVASNVGVTPRFAFATGSVTHSLVGAFTQQRSDQTVPGAGTDTNTRATTLLVSWTSSLRNGLSILANGNRTRVEVDTLATAITSISPGVAWTGLQGRLSVSTQMQITDSGLEGAEATREIYPLGDVQWRVTPSQTIALRSSLRRIRTPGAPDGTGLMTERWVRVEYRANLR